MPRLPHVLALGPAAACALALGVPAVASAQLAAAPTATSSSGPIVCLPQRPELCVTDDPNCLVDANWRCWPQELLPQVTASRTV